MVPAEQMYSLHRRQKSRQCRLVEFPSAHHMDAYDVEPVMYWTALKNFMGSLEENASAPRICSTNL
jgi:fermentation-respiration switch protein FrsA (DUF1100 family)